MRPTFFAPAAAQGFTASSDKGIVRMDSGPRDENLMVITMARVARIGTAVAAVVCCWLAYAAASLACGSDYSGPVVEHGRSPGGQRWFQLACLTSKNHIEVDISLPGPGGTDGGGGMLTPMPTQRSSVYVDAPGVGLGAHGNEAEIDGVAFRTTVRLKLYYRTGKLRTTRTVQLRLRSAGDSVIYVDCVLRVLLRRPARASTAGLRVRYSWSTLVLRARAGSVAPDVVARLER